MREHMSHQERRELWRERIAASTTAVCPLPSSAPKHVDGYVGYEGMPDVELVGCWAHARRKFDEALKAVPVKER